MTESTQTDIWIKQLCAGEESAYKLFFDEYYQILAHFAMKYVQEAEVCEDIIHDVVLDLYSHKRIFPNINSLKSFLYLSVKNRCLNYIDHIKAKERYLQDATIQSQEYFLDSIIEEEVYYLMHKAIKELPDQVQKIYELTLNGKSNEEIAQELSLSLDSVKAYKKRGKQMLKEKLKDFMCFLSVTI